MVEFNISSILHMPDKAVFNGIKHICREITKGEHLAAAADDHKNFGCRSSGNQWTSSDLWMVLLTV